MSVTPQKTKKAPKAQQRGEKRQHILELLTVEQPRSTDELAYFTGIPLRMISSVLILMERARLVRRAKRGRGQGKIKRGEDPGPSLWALRSWKEGA
jgi:predicted Rossmann fold nucleotide-binding protein DprA/Smf involved in DNA uptake